MHTTYQDELAVLILAEFRKHRRITDHMWKLYRYDCRAGGARPHTRKFLSDLCGCIIK